MSDYQIRIALKKNTLRDYYLDSNTRVIEELGLSHGSSRIDIAIVNDRLIGYELKSGQDTLKRLPRQVQYYNAVFSKLILVVDYRHAYDATKIIPQWWGVYFVETLPDGRVKSVSIARPPQENPLQSKSAIVKLLWKEEAVYYLEEIGLAKGYRSKTKREIYDRIVEHVNIDSLQSYVCKTLKNRVYWRADASQLTYAY